MLLFDPSHVRAGYNGATTPGESLFQFLSSRDDEVAHTSRLRIEQLLGRFPETVRNKLIAEMRGKHDRQFYGALLEAVCWSLFLSAGWESVAEPAASGGSKPDFAIYPFGRSPVLIEATADLGEPDESRDQRAIHDLDTSAAKYITIPGYRLLAEYVKLTPSQPPSPKAFGRYVDQLFKELMERGVRPKLGSTAHFDGSALSVWDDGRGNQVGFRIIHRTSNTLPSKLFAMGPTRGGFVDESRAVGKLKDKLSQHRSDSAPKVLVFANCCSLRADREELYAHRTLFGTERFHFPRPQYPNEVPAQSQPQLNVTYDDDGLWSRIRNTIEPTALLWIEGLSPWRLNDIDGRLWHNPRHELLGLRSKWRGHQAYFDLDYRLVKAEGTTLGDLLDLQ